MSHVIRFARQYHGKEFLFLSLSTRPDQTDEDLNQRLKSLLRFLRGSHKVLEYLAARTNEGNGVYHLILVSSKRYISIEKVTAFWGSHCWIEKEHDFGGLLYEMVTQKQLERYSMSRGFLPDGAKRAIEAIERSFKGQEGMVARGQLARRWKRDVKTALERTEECCFRKGGWCCDLRSRREYNVRMRG